MMGAGRVMAVFYQRMEKSPEGGAAVRRLILAHLSFTTRVRFRSNGFPFRVYDLAGGRLPNWAFPNATRRRTSSSVLPMRKAMKGVVEQFQLSSKKVCPRALNTIPTLAVALRNKPEVALVRFSPALRCRLFGDSLALRRRQLLCPRLAALEPA